VREQFNGSTASKQQSYIYLNHPQAPCRTVALAVSLVCGEAVFTSAQNPVAEENEDQGLHVPLSGYDL
jgi:hypothetical protein